MRIIILVFASAVFTLCSAPSAFSSDQIDSHISENYKVHTNPHAGYVKPGAAVALSHDYDGKTELGELETLSVTLSHLYQSGTLSVALLTAQDIQITAFNPIKKRPVSHGSTLDLSVQFSGTNQGDFTISLETVYTDLDGHESRRVLSIPVNIGGKAFEKIPALDNGELNTTRKLGVISLKAIEVIE